MKDYYVMEYMYRDANNFKAFGQLLLTGNITDCHKRRNYFFRRMGGYCYINIKISACKARLGLQGISSLFEFLNHVKKY